MISGPNPHSAGFSKTLRLGIDALGFEGSRDLVNHRGLLDGEMVGPPECLHEHVPRDQRFDILRHSICLAQTTMTSILVLVITSG